VSGRADLQIRDATAADAAAVAAVYNHYVLGTTVTFEETAVPSTVMAERIAGVQERGLPWLVALRDGTLIGYAYAGPWNQRDAYRHTVEVSAYLAEEARGQGTGTALYEVLFTRLRALGAHAVIAVISLPNPDSVALHEHVGLCKAGEFREVGSKLGRWIDVGYWHALL
jgi:phosphinothricin acetyltransferase